jgi:hypothetical protein
VLTCAVSVCGLIFSAVALFFRLDGPRRGLAGPGSSAVLTLVSLDLLDEAQRVFLIRGHTKALLSMQGNHHRSIRWEYSKDLLQVMYEKVKRLLTVSGIKE